MWGFGRSHQRANGRRLAGRDLLTILAWLIALSALSVLAGCTTYSQQQAEVHRHLYQGKPAQALTQLREQKPPARNQVLHDLNRGRLLQMTGDYRASIEALQAAKRQMIALDPISVSENFTALTVNEGSRSYHGQPYEDLLVHALLALNYLFIGELDSARVEVRQADALLQQQDDQLMHHSAAWVRYLSGVIFEHNGEPDQALVAYRQAQRLYDQREWPTPAPVINDLLRLTHYLGLKAEHRQLAERYPDAQWQRQRQWRRGADVLVVQLDGLVTPLLEKRALGFSEDLSKNVAIALPFYPSILTPAEPQSFTLAEQTYDLALMEDIDQLAREDLRQRLPGLTAAAIARAAIKQAAADAAAQEDAGAGAVVNLMGVLTERADTRSWSTLPARVLLLRQSVPAGEYRLDGLGTVTLPAGQLSVILRQQVNTRAPNLVQAP